LDIITFYYKLFIVELLAFFPMAALLQLDFSDTYEQWSNSVSWGAAMAQWWKHYPPANVMWVRILASQVGWVYCSLLALPQAFFSGFSSFHPLTKINTFKFQFDFETVDEEPLHDRMCHCKFLFVYLRQLLFKFRASANIISLKPTHSTVTFGILF